MTYLQRPASATCISVHKSYLLANIHPHYFAITPSRYKKNTKGRRKTQWHPSILIQDATPYLSPALYRAPLPPSPYHFVAKQYDVITFSSSFFPFFEYRTPPGTFRCRYFSGIKVDVDFLWE